MQELNTIAVALAFLFLVPGYIIHSIISSVTPRRRDETQLLALRFLAFSAVNAFLCAPLLFQIKRSYPLHLISAKNWGLLFVVLLIAPVVIGIVVAWIERFGLLSKAFYEIELGLLGQSPSAWDTKFKSMSGEHAYMVVTLVGGRTIYGYFGSASIASTDTSERDLFLQRLYTLKPNGEWKPVPNSGGILIKASVIESIEIRREVNPWPTKKSLLLKTWLSLSHNLRVFTNLLRTRIIVPMLQLAAMGAGERAATTRRQVALVSCLRRKLPQRRNQI